MIFFYRISFSLLISLSLIDSLSSQVIEKPLGCFAGTNGTHIDVLEHNDSRGVLLVEKWSDLERKPGVFDFEPLLQKIELVKGAGLNYALAISGGAFGSPRWLIDSFGVKVHQFEYQNQTWELPLWWEPQVQDRLNILIDQLGEHFGLDPNLSHIYVTQMTVNGIEGHLNGVDMEDFKIDGYNPSIWIDVAVQTSLAFAESFPDKPIVFEIHEIDRDTLVPSEIIHTLNQNETLCERFGLGMWWISGKSSYQSNLLELIRQFDGDKYAQVIGRSDQEQRFENGDYGTVFQQAKELNIRYIEPWPYEFQFHTHDALLNDFNKWADENFSASDSCRSTTGVLEYEKPSNAFVFPNPTSHEIQTDASDVIHFSIFDLNGNMMVRSISNIVDCSTLAEGIYLYEIKTKSNLYCGKLIKI